MEIDTVSISLNHRIYSALEQLKGTSPQVDQSKICQQSRANTKKIQTRNNNNPRYTLFDIKECIKKMAKSSQV